MSMSSLSSQLASLQKTSTRNAGSSLSSSKSHADAIGRGLTHSVQHGHSIARNSAKHKPSVLYTDSKSASDVPLTTLRENCVSSLRQLAKLTGNTEFCSQKYLVTLAGVHSLQMERGLATKSENDKLDTIIGELLVLLSTAMGESSSSSSSTTSTFSSSLHVLEYLLRRHDIHIREATAELLVICVLPFHEDPVFGRVLQLVDLASLSTFSWLRPFAQASSLSSMPTRTLLAKRAAQNNALIQIYCKMAKQAATIHAAECDYAVTPRRGISRILSFAAAVLMEALHIQTTNPKHYGSISETTLRVMMPFVLEACSSELASVCCDWRGFGHVLASCICELSVLSTDARETLATAIVNGVLTLQQACDEDKVRVQLVADGMATLMSVVSTSPKQQASGGDATSHSKLAIIPSRNKNNVVENQYIGYVLPLDTYKSIVKLDSLATAVGHLYSDRNLVVAPLVASLVALSLSRLNQEKSVDLILNLIQQDALEPMWKDQDLNLTASIAAAVLEANMSSTESVEGAKAIIKALQTVFASGCDAGIAHAVTHISKSNDGSDETVRERLLQVLDVSPNDLNVSSQDMDIDSAASLMLPPRVALEHADASVRLNAIERLVANVSSSSINFDAGGESLEEALLRHFLVEDELNVAVAAGEALVSLLDDSKASFHVTPAFSDDCMKALQKWTLDESSFPVAKEEASKTKKKEDKTSMTGDVDGKRVRALEVALEIAGNAALLLNTNLDRDAVSLFVEQQLLQGIIAHADLTEEHAACALSKALGREATKTVNNLLLTTESLLNGLRRYWKDEDGLELLSEGSFSRRYLGVYLNVFVGALEAPRKSKANSSLGTIASDSLSTCVLMVQGCDGIETKAIESLVRQFKTCSEHAKVLEASKLLDIIMKLSSVPLENTFKSLCVPAIVCLCDEFASANGVSKLRILMESALRPELPVAAVMRLISLVCSTISDEDDAQASSLAEAIIFVLALLGHSDQTVRKAALQLIRVARDASSSATMDVDQAGCLGALFTVTSDEASKETSRIILDGSSALPALLAGMVSVSKNGKNATSHLLKLCSRTACSMSAISDDDTRWLSFNEGKGGCRAAALVLNALELSGEPTSPLLQRYNIAGRDILGALLAEGSDEVTETVLSLIHLVARMIKGVIVVDSSSVGSDMIISTGPSRRGTRTRSYSVGRSPGVSFIEPYPKVMRDDILMCLSYQEADSEVDVMKKEVCRAMIHDVLGSPSWADGVFKTLDKTYRKKLLELLLYLWKSESVPGSGEAFLGLELNGKDIADLIRVEGVKKPDVCSIIFLCDYIHSHAERLKSSLGFVDLISLLFQTLEAISLNEWTEDDRDEVEFARQGLLKIIAGLVPYESTNAHSKRKKAFPKRDLMKWASLLVRLIGGTVGGTKPKQLRALPFGRPKSLAFALLASLCSEDPGSIVAMLVPAMLDSISVNPSASDGNRQSSLEFRVSNDIFVSVVPVFFKYAALAGLNQYDLYNQVLTKAAEIQDENRRMVLYSCMVEAISAASSGDVNGSSHIGSFVAAIVAFDVANNEPTATAEMSPAVKLAAGVLQMCSPAIQVASLTKLVGYTYQLLKEISSGDQMEDERRRLSIDTSLDELEGSIMFHSKPDETTRQAERMSATVTLLAIVSNSLATPPVMNLIMKGNEESSKLSLGLWQDLLMLQSTYVHGGPEDDVDDGSRRRFWGECQRLVDSCLAQLQSLLPAHLFLASAAMLIEDGSDTELCSRAIGLVSERAAHTDSESAEASLFLEMLPMLSRLLASPNASDENAEAAMLVQQSVFVAVEIFARSLCLQSATANRGKLNEFTEVLKKATAIIKVYAAPFEHKNGVLTALDSPSCQVFCSAALCTSTLVRLLTVRSLPFLPDLVGSLLSVLSSVNQAISDQWSAASKGHAAVLQVSILRAILAIADTLPQFLGPYLGQLLSPSALLSSWLRMEDTEQQVAASALASKLQTTLSQKIPARQLIPSLCKSLPNCNEHGELHALLAMLKESVQQAPRSEVPALRSWLVKTLILAYEFRGTNDDGETTHLVDEANIVLLALVMKLSEAQLRPLYAKLREWRGDVESGMDDDDVAVKRYAFWSLSALLSSQLRSIFLPCLSTVMLDAVKELEHAAAKLCGSFSKKKIDGGRKRQRLDSSSTSNTTEETWNFLKPLLGCLETAFHADASEGGKWIRHDDSRRYHSLLSPLSQLLELHTHNDFSHEVVYGAEGETVDNGSVIGCLTALASAAGNEQLWKPLNHAVLQACGNESRSQTRMAGVTCLLSLIKALGEEYMVLLPECLPVLSELLEETDEEIAGLAQECVSIGEELLGESLQDSLR